MRGEPNGLVGFDALWPVGGDDEAVVTAICFCRCQANSWLRCRCYLLRASLINSDAEDVAVAEDADVVV